jgi:hypothetical protein
MRAFGTLRAILLWVLPAIGIAEAGLAVVRHLVPAGALAAANDVVGNYLQTLGTIYAVLLAFVVFVVWQQFNDARASIDREANELMDLYRTATGLPDPTGADIRRHAREYVDVVLDHEWEAMRRGDDIALHRGASLLDAMWRSMHVFEAESHCHAAIHGEMLGRFNDLSDARQARVIAARLRIPRALRILIYMGAVTTSASMYLFAVDSIVIHALMTGAIAGALSHVLYVIHDLDDCFAGDWQVPRSSFEGLRGYIKDKGDAA